MSQTTTPLPPAPSVHESVVSFTGVTKQYGRDETAVFALREVDIALARGSFTTIMGPSGSGKSTFLHCAAGLDRPTSGTVRLAGIDLGGLDEDRLSRLRRERIGFVFQSFNLVPALTTRQNILLPLKLAGVRPDPALLDEVVGRMGLTSRLEHRPSELSGGQQQRVAIARALVTEPDVVFADEPTGALDIRTGSEILDLLREAVDALGRTVVMVTHDPGAASMTDRVVFLADGALVGVVDSPTVEIVAARMTRLAG